MENKVPNDFIFQPPDISKYSKKMTFQKIINENNLSGPELAVFGDGPVEIRECRKMDGVAIGVASDEVRRYDLNLDKNKPTIIFTSTWNVDGLSALDKWIDKNRRHF